MARANLHNPLMRRFGRFSTGPIIRAKQMASASTIASAPIIRERVTNLQSQQDSAVWLFSNQIRVLVPRVLAKHIGVGDEITFSIPAPDAVGSEMLVTKNDGLTPIIETLESCTTPIERMSHKWQKAAKASGEGQRRSSGLWSG